MCEIFKKSIKFFIFLIMSLTSFAQKDVTQFLGVPVDGSKSEMIQKLKAKGYAISPYKNDVLVGEFNGTDVNIFIATNNNKVCRIIVSNVGKMSETDVRIKFNNLIQQFQSNKKYFSLPDSTISKYYIPEDEDISYELSIKNKRYEAIFYQLSADYESLQTEMINLLKNETLNDTDKKRVEVITKKLVENTLNKTVWFMINESNGKYYISIFYDNEYNRANGEGL